MPLIPTPGGPTPHPPAAVDGVAALAARALALPPGRDEEWRGTFQGTEGSTEGFAFEVRARLLFRGGAVSGIGRGVDLNTPHRDLTFTGSDHGGFVDIHLWFEDPDFAGRPLACSAAFDDGGDRMDGGWTVECLHPRECGCDGGRGTFGLRRVSRPDRAD